MKVAAVALAVVFWNSQKAACQEHTACSGAVAGRCLAGILDITGNVHNEPVSKRMAFPFFVLSWLQS